MMDVITEALLAEILLDRRNGVVDQDLLKKIVSIYTFL